MERFRQVVEFSPNAFVLIDRGGLISMVNHQTERLFGYHREELLGQPVEILLPERFREKHPEHRAGFFSNPVPRAMGGGRDLFGRRKDGSEVPVEIGLNPIQTSDGLFVLAAVVDITERRAAQEEMKRMNERLRAALTQNELLLKEVHHRVKNNLQLIISIIDLQIGTIKNEPQKEIFRKVIERIHSMALVHESFYRSPDLSKIEFGQYLRALVNNLLQAFEGGRSIQIHIDCPELYLDVDKAVLCGLLLNELITNSLTHAFEGREEGAIRVEVRRAGPMTDICYRDDGAGLPKKIGSDTLGFTLIRDLGSQLGHIVFPEEGESGYKIRMKTG